MHDNKNKKQPSEPHDLLAMRDLLAEYMELKTFDLFRLCSHNTQTQDQSLPLSQAQARSRTTHTHIPQSKRILWVTHFFPRLVGAVTASPLLLLLFCFFFNCTHAYEFILFASFIGILCSRAFFIHTHTLTELKGEKKKKQK